MKKLVLITLIILMILSISPVVAINLSFETNPAYSGLSTEEKEVVCHYNRYYSNLANDFKIVSVNKHSKDNYHIMISSSIGFWELCHNSSCDINNNGICEIYKPVGNGYLDADIQKINEIIDNSDTNYDLEKITKAIDADSSSSHIHDYGKIIPIVIIIFVVLLILLGIPTFIIGGIITKKRKAKNTQST